MNNSYQLKNAVISHKYHISNTNFFDKIQLKKLIILYTLFSRTRISSLRQQTITNESIKLL